MKKSAVIFALLFVVAHASAEVRLFGWQESQDEKTGEKPYGFFLAPKAVMEAMEADAKGDAKAAKALVGKSQEELWDDGILLGGEATIYQRESLTLFEPSPCGSMLEVTSGSVEVDRKTGTMRVTLKVTQDGKLGDFRGNGTYAIRKKSAK
jgi:hypothetical protein